MPKKQDVSKEMICNYMKEIGATNEDSSVTYYDLAIYFGVVPQNKKDVIKLKKECRIATEEGLISIFKKDNGSHLYLKKQFKR